MKLSKYPVRLFSDTKAGNDFSILVPEGSKLLSLEVLPDGIYAFLATPELEVPMTDQHRFWIGNTELSIPENAEFMSILSVFVNDGPGKEGLAIFPIFKLN
jgi:hypothetical protein